uniref:formate dehydrogenase accessory protein FdhE n=2 Tax=Pseudomonas TaxID=286 RepID=UPI001266E10A
HPMGDYLRLVAGLCRLQQALLDNPPALAPLDPERLRKSREHGMPPLAYDLLVREGAWLPWLDALLAGYPAPANAAVGAALEQLREADEGQRKAWAIALLSGQFDLLPAALVPFLGAALQIAWSHWLLGLEEGAVVETESRTLCPACGSPPMAGMIRQGGKETGLRYLSCSLCACEWHYVRIKCSHCEESKHLAYLSLEHDGQPAEKAVLRAETCPSCQGYLKQFYLEFDRHADALADDLASLALDMRLAEDGYLRRSPNLLLAPGGE